MSNSLRVNEAWVRSLVRDMPVISNQEFRLTKERELGARYILYAHIYHEFLENGTPKEILKLPVLRFIGDRRPEEYASTTISDARMIELFHNVWSGSEPCPLKTNNHLFIPIFEKLMKASEEDINGELVNWTALAKEINGSIHEETAGLFNESSLTIEDILSLRNTTRKVTLLVELAISSTEDKAQIFNDHIKACNAYQRIIGDKFIKDRGFTNANLAVGAMSWWKNPAYDKRKKQR